MAFPFATKDRMRVAIALNVKVVVVRQQLLVLLPRQRGLEQLLDSLSPVPFPLNFE